MDNTEEENLDNIANIYLGKNLSRSLGPKFSEKIGGKSTLENRAFSGLIGAFPRPIIGTNCSAPHRHTGKGRNCPKKGPFWPNCRLSGQAPFAKPPFRFPRRMSRICQKNVGKMPKLPANTVFTYLRWPRAVAYFQTKLKLCKIVSHSVLQCRDFCVFFRGLEQGKGRLSMGPRKNINSPPPSPQTSPPGALPPPTPPPCINPPLPLF